MLRVHRRQATHAPRFRDASLAPHTPESIKAIVALLHYLRNPGTAPAVTEGTGGGHGEGSQEASGPSALGDAVGNASHR